jgi:hypothetical protein
VRAIQRHPDAWSAANNSSSAGFLEGVGKKMIWSMDEEGEEVKQQKMAYHSTHPPKWMDFASLGQLVSLSSLSRGGWVGSCPAFRQNSPTNPHSFLWVVMVTWQLLLRYGLTRKGRWTECMGPLSLVWIALMRREVVGVCKGPWLHFVAEIVRAYRLFFLGDIQASENTESSVS